MRLVSVDSGRWLVPVSPRPTLHDIFSRMTSDSRCKRQGCIALLLLYVSLRHPNLACGGDCSAICSK